MITIAKVPLDVSTIIKNYPEKSIELEVFNLLSKSTNIYDYSSIEEMNFELKMRQAIVEAAISLYKSQMDFAIFRKARCNELFWKLTKEGGFLLENNVKASQAITDIFNNGQLYATECATAMVIIYYKALLTVMGEEVFNKLFTQIHLMNWHYIDNRLDDIGYMQPVKDYLPGDRRYFANPDVDPQTPQWQGENTLDLSQKLYYGHGIGILEGPKIIEALNQNRKNNSTKTAYLMDTVGIPDFKSLYKLL